MRTRIHIAAATTAAVVALGAPLASATANASHSTVPPWERALMVRGRALDRAHHLGSFCPIPRGYLAAAARDSGWLRALRLRSIGLDRIHHLGSFAWPPEM